MVWFSQKLSLSKVQGTNQLVSILIPATKWKIDLKYMDQFRLQFFGVVESLLLSCLRKTRYTRTNPRFFYVPHHGECLWRCFIETHDTSTVRHHFVWSSWNLIGACGQGPSGDDGGTDLFVQKMSEASELPTATCDGWTLVLFVKLGCQRLETKGGEIMHNHILYIHIIVMILLMNIILYVIYIFVL